MADDERAPEALKQEVDDWVDSQRDALLEISHRIHAHPELAFEEHAACSLLVDALRRAGLDVETPIGGLDTAFATEFGTGDGPTVALLAEYDALPEIGHACGHNLIATAAVGAGLALAALDGDLPGRIRVLGTPAEEVGGGKELMMREGVFDGIDCALMIHPAGFNLGAMPCICKSDVEVAYRGRASHASAAPERGVNALDALVMAYQSIAALRQHIRGDERIHGIITDGGQAPNIVPEYAAATFYVRSPFQKGLEKLRTRVQACLEAGATAAGATLEYNWSEVDYLDLRSNQPLEEAFVENAQRLGRDFIPKSKMAPMMAGSTDMGNVSHKFPAIHPMLAAAPLNVSIHNRAFADHAGGELGDAAALDGVKTLAMTALDFLYSPSLQERTKNVFETSEVR
ncbi:MAG: M20 family metallopeptidase [Myxococcota bacterium]|nr:M20 family metallopeptidase [Myxococcota bacterium]